MSLMIKNTSKELLLAFRSAELVGVDEFDKYLKPSMKASQEHAGVHSYKRGLNRCGARRLRRAAKTAQLLLKERG